MFLYLFFIIFPDFFKLLKIETRSLLGHRFLSTCLAKLLLFVAYPEHRRSVSPPLQIRNFSVLSTVEDQSIISQKKSMTKVTFCLCFEQWKKSEKKIKTKNTCYSTFKHWYYQNEWCDVDDINAPKRYRASADMTRQRDL